MSSVFISTYSFNTAQIYGQQRLQQQLSDMQGELASGKKADYEGVLGATTGYYVSMTEQSSELQNFIQGNAIATQRLDTLNTALGSMSALVTSLQSDLTSLKNTANGATALQSEAQSSLQQMIGYANTNVNGEYVFGGQNTGTAPMNAYDASNPGANKKAVDASFQSYFGFSPTSSQAQSITADQMQSYLTKAFAPLFSGSNWTSNWSNATDSTLSNKISTTQSVSTTQSANSSAFQSMTQAMTMLSEFTGANLNKDAFGAVSTAASTLLGTATTQLTELNAAVGDSQKTVTNVNQSMQAQVNYLKTTAGSLDSVDSYALSTQLDAMTKDLQASYMATAKIQQISILNYL